MGGIVVKSIEKPDETRKFAGHGWLDVVTIGDLTVGRGTFQPGWRWSNDVKPIAGTDSCQAPHNAVVLAGRMVIRMNDGTETEIGPGDVFDCPPGHDAWTLGEEDCVMLDFAKGAPSDYAKPAT